MAENIWVYEHKSHRNLHALSVKSINNNQYPSRDRPDALPTLISLSTA